jgi:hypothetical protein
MSAHSFLTSNENPRYKKSSFNVKKLNDNIIAELDKIYLHS